MFFVQFVNCSFEINDVVVELKSNYSFIFLRKLLAIVTWISFSDILGALQTFERFFIRKFLEALQYSY